MSFRWVIVVPWRGGSAERERSWEWTQGWWQRFGVPVLMSEHPGPDPFNRGLAINRGATELLPWDVMLVIDADVVEDRDEQVLETVELAWKTGRLTVGHTGSKDLNPAGTRALLAGKSFDWNRFVEKRRPICNSRVNAVRADLFEAVGGFDTRFRGWGHEDGAFMRSCIALAGQLERPKGDCWHLYHVPAIAAARKTNEYAANRALAGRYLAAFKGDISGNTVLPGPPEMRGWPAMKAILDERALDEQWMRPSAARRNGSRILSARPAIADLVVISCGRRQYLTRTLRAARENLIGRIGKRIIFDDSGDPDTHRWLQESFPEFEVSASEAQLGFTKTMARAWRYLATTAGAPFIFHLEDDFRLDRPVALADLARVLELEPKLAQVVLLRGAYYPRELQAGSIIAEHPESYEVRKVSGLSWMQHQRFFSANPCMYRRSLAQTAWPDRSNSEAVFGRQLVAKGMSFAFFGDGDPWVTHIGAERAGVGGY